MQDTFYLSCFINIDFKVAEPIFKTDNSTLREKIHQQVIMVYYTTIFFILVVVSLQHFSFVTDFSFSK